MKLPFILILACVGAFFEVNNAANIQEEIYQGLTAAPQQFPYQVLMINKKFEEGSTTPVFSFCGGAIMKCNIVLTAAHCLKGINSSTVYFGLSDTSKGEGAIFYAVDEKNFVIHKDYNSNSYLNDIAIIKLPGCIKYTAAIKPILLPPKGWLDCSMLDGKPMTVSGFGQTLKEQEGVTQNLQYSETTKLPQASCEQIFQEINPIAPGMICCSKACHGDSGGPLTIIVNGNIYLVGLVSWGVGACGNEYPVVFTCVITFMPWILETANMTQPTLP